jgi:hypothetical protein
MQRQASLPPIPWSHQISEFGALWKWDTKHFVVTVNGDVRSCYFQIADKVSNPAGEPRPFQDGRAATFEQAELLIREVIGKAYKPALGYSQYAGALATTFRLANGQDVDLGPYTGHTTVATILSPDGSTTDYAGVARIEHYELVLAGEQTYRISPSHITALRISGRTANAPVASKAKANRTVAGTVTLGCTGKAGFLPNTIEHTGRICPIHEEGV